MRGILENLTRRVFRQTLTAFGVGVVAGYLLVSALTGTPASEENLDEVLERSERFEEIYYDLEEAIVENDTQS